MSELSGKPRVLMLTPWAPFPLDAGSRRIWTACKYLRDRYDFFLLTFLDTSRSFSVSAVAERLWREQNYFRDIFREVHSIPHRHEPASERLNGFYLPEDVRRYYSPRMWEKILEVVRERKIDLVHVEFDLMAPYMHFIKKEFPHIPCFFTQHDVGTISLFRSYFREMADWRRFLWLIHWWRRVLFTRKVCGLFDAVIVLTEPDRRRLARLLDATKIHVVPTGVDLEHFSEFPPRWERDSLRIVYVGHYPHYPNEDAVLWFSREILPRIWRQIPEVKFSVVGSYPAPAILDLARRDSRIQVTGTVEDVKPYEQKAMVMVAPLRLGQGIKGKLLEAFAVGTPVVATSCANEGVGAVPDRDILIADSPGKFARQTVRLLTDPALWERLHKNGRAFVKSFYGWGIRAAELGRVYQKFLNQKEREGLRL